LRRLVPEARFGEAGYSWLTNSVYLVVWYCLNTYLSQRPIESIGLPSISVHLLPKLKIYVLGDYMQDDRTCNRMMDDIFSSAAHDTKSVAQASRGYTSNDGYDCGANVRQILVLLFPVPTGFNTSHLPSSATNAVQSIMISPSAACCTRAQRCIMYPTSW